jgi:Transport and Golgi organisation 2
MCTAVLSIEPGLPVLLAGIRDELTDRAWKRPWRHWPAYPGLIGGLDLQAGGTWLAVDPRQRRVSCVLNGRGELAPVAARTSRGDLPLSSAAGEPLLRSRLVSLDPFHLLTAEPGRAVMQSWDGARLTERELGPGLHMVVNSGLASDLPAADARASEPSVLQSEPTDRQSEHSDHQDGQAPNGRHHELARIAHFLPRFSGAARPVPKPGEPVPDAWGDWLPLVDGDGITPGDSRALIVRRELGDGRAWGTTSVSLVALSPQAVRYDFTGTPGDPAAWYSVPCVAAVRNA